MTVSPAAPPVELRSRDEPDIASLGSLLAVLLQDRYRVIGLGVYGAVIAILVLLLLPAKYTSESSFMLQTRGLPSNLSGFAAQLGVALPGTEASQSPAFYSDLLQSREILGAVVDDSFALAGEGARRSAGLAHWLGVSASDPRLRREKTIRKLQGDVAVTPSSKTGVVTLRVTTHNAELSALISQRMLTWLNEFNLQKRQSQATAERVFTERRLDEAHKELSDAEGRLLDFTQRNRAGTASSPLMKLEEDRLGREVSMRQEVYTSMVQAYDRAKIDEVRDTPVITVLLAPESPVRPDSRGLAGGAVLGLLLGVVVASMLAILRESFVPPVDRPRRTQEIARLNAQAGGDLRHPLRTLYRALRLQGPITSS